VRVAGTRECRPGHPQGPNSQVGIVSGCVVECGLSQYQLHPFDCTQFIRCTAEGPTVLHCKGGARWDRAQSACRHGAKCETGVYSTPDGERCGGR